MSRWLLALGLLAGCGGGMQSSLEQVDAALEQAQPYALTGCDMYSAEVDRLECQEFLAAYEHLLEASAKAKVCMELPQELVSAYRKLRAVTPKDD